ncbi:MAG: hypothetical protein LBG89_03065 [Rickettsiales bacterium]|jgi:hypothetical protein|nr:hypothetical protein [Rickettsiales bacterium]
MQLHEIHATPAVQQMIKDKIDETHKHCQAGLGERDARWAEIYLALTKKQEFLFDWLKQMALSKQRQVAA